MFFQRIRFLKKAVFLAIFSGVFLSAAFSQEEDVFEEIIADEEEEKPFVQYTKIDLPDFERPEVEKYRKQYLSPKYSAELYVILKNGERYRHYIRRRLKEEKLPLFIELIPVIESSYRANAKPKDGRSLGLWQFLENSIEDYMIKNEWIDERLDPWKSTDAALAKLKANYKRFDDWLLAVAAYNCGATAVSRALKKSDKKTFWALCEKKLIPQHAINYVPRLLAISDITFNSDYYEAGLPRFDPDEKSYSPFLDFDFLEVDFCVSLEALACEMRMDFEILKELNPALVHGVTPPSQNYKIRLPAGKKEAASDALFCVMLRKKIADSK